MKLTIFDMRQRRIDWGLDVFRGRVEPFICEACGGDIRFRDEYLYKFTPEGTRLLHNKEGCNERAIGEA
jgi:hypothetical protein